MRTLPLLLWLVACATEAPEPTATCTSCHGSEATGPAPPMALGGITDPTSRGVGAHTQHLQGRIANPIACNECHEVPTTVDAEGHIDTPWPAETKWGDLGKTDGAEITWDPVGLTCSGAYCHGGTFAAPGQHSVPVWIDTTGLQAGCDSCHQFPPPAPHPDDNDCGACHAPTATGTTLTDTTTHIDGILQVDGGGATSCAFGCHGDEDSPAPGSGAHAQHLDATLGSPVACTTCHPVPVDTNDPPHLDGVNDIVFGGIAESDGVVSTFAPGSASCTTYCHGASLGGGLATQPAWSQVDGTFSACDSCHGNPPPPPHPANPSCGGCHPDGGASNPANHIDANVDL